MSSHNKTKSESFFTRCKQLEAELKKTDDKILSIINKHSSEIYMKDKQIKILEQQLKNTHEQLKETTISLNKSEARRNNIIKKLDSVRIYAGEMI